MSRNNIRICIYLSYAARETYCSLEQWKNFYYIILKEKKLRHYTAVYYILKCIFLYFLLIYFDTLFVGQ